MSLSELLPTIRSLPRADKVRLMEMLAADVAGNNEGLSFEFPEGVVPISSPHDSFAGAVTLLRLLDAGEADS